MIFPITSALNLILASFTQQYIPMRTHRISNIYHLEIVSSWRPYEVPCTARIDPATSAGLKERCLTSRVIHCILSFPVCSAELKILVPHLETYHGLGPSWSERISTYWAIQTARALPMKSISARFQGSSPLSNIILDVRTLDLITNRSASQLDIVRKFGPDLTRWNTWTEYLEPTPRILVVKSSWFTISKYFFRTTVSSLCEDYDITRAFNATDLSVSQSSSIFVTHFE